jgi:hypothetical protein
MIGYSSAKKTGDLKIWEMWEQVFFGVFWEGSRHADWLAHFAMRPIKNILSMATGKVLK